MYLSDPGLNMNTRSIFFASSVVVCLAAAFFAALKMKSLLLWGDYPLFFTLGVWMSISLLFQWKYKPLQPLDRPFLLSTLSGVLLGKAFIFTSPLLAIGFVPLMLTSVDLEKSGPTPLSRHAWIAFHGFLVWNICATYWVANAALIPGLVAFSLNSLFMTAPWIAAVKLGRYFPRLRWISFVAFWICFEWVHHVWEISWPWLTLGNGLAFVSKWIQWYEFTGTFGGSLWILLLNVLMLQIITKSTFRYVRILVWTLLLVLPPFLSLQILDKVNVDGQPVEVGIVQPNYEPHYEKFKVDPELQMIKYEKLSRSAMSPNTRFLLWPETSFEFLTSGNFEEHWSLARMKQIVSVYPSLCLVTGLGTIKPIQKGEPLTAAARPNRMGNPEYFEVQNSAALICGDSNEYPVYVKSKLVPGVETFPYRQFLPFLKPIVDILGGSVYGLGKQAQRSIFEQSNLKIAPVICYESIYGAYIGDYIRKGAEAIFIMTNDGWWDDTPGYRQHLYFGALRAIEYRRPIARSANTGISCFINAKGEILNPTSYGKDAALRKTIHFSGQQTIYLKYGDIIAYCATVISVLLLLLGSLTTLRVRFSKSQ